MVNYCVVPGCKTNRRNEVKLPVFQFPKDPCLKEEWKKIMGIEHLNARKQHRVCQKHFAKEDVITCTNFFDSSGNHIATLPSKIPRLRKNAKPCFIQISAEEEAAINQRINARNFNPDLLYRDNNNETEKNDTSHDSRETVDSESLEYSKRTSNTSYNDDDDNNNKEENVILKEEKNEVINAAPQLEENVMLTSQSEQSAINVDNNNYETIDTNSNFLSLCQSFKEVILPENCYLNFSTSERHRYIALFEISVVRSAATSHNAREKESSDTFVKRSLNVNNNLEIHYSVSNKPIRPDAFDLKSRVECVNELELCSRQFFTLNVCEGIADFKDVDLVKDKISYTDSLGVLRHHQCKLLSPTEKCNVCSRVRKTISQKKLRMSRRKRKRSNTDTDDGDENEGEGVVVPVATIDSIDLDPVNRDSPSLSSSSSSLHVWKRTVRAQRKVIYRAKLKIKKMKSEIDKIKTNIKNVNLNDLLENCVKNKIPDVQKVLIQEIVSLAKSKNQNGHRYNENWVMLCLLLHIRSPTEYRHMRNINLLPLPCERTIRKYLSMTRLPTTLPTTTTTAN